MKNGIAIEICTGSLSDIIAAEKVPDTDRYELNCALELGGLTPSLATLMAVKKVTVKPVICMVRPRGGGFVFNEYEKNTMYRDAKLFLENGADGIVFGCLKQDRTVDKEFASAMVQLIHSFGKEAVFHKAFDDARDLFEASEALIRCGVDRILTSGSRPDALTGADTIRMLNEKYGNSLSCLPGGGVSESNVSEILRISGCKQIHMSAKITLNDGGDYLTVSSERIEKIINEI